MSHPEEEPERTAGGILGAVAGKAKEAAGSLTGNDDLTREGRLQQAQADADREAAGRQAEAQRKAAEADVQAEQAEVESERQRLQNELDAQRREERLVADRRRAEGEAQAEAVERKQAAQAERRAMENAAEATEEQAEQDRLAAAKRSIDLEQQARQAERTADHIDPEEPA